MLLLHDGSRAHSDLFKAVLTMLDPGVALGVLPVSPDGAEPPAGAAAVHGDEERARKLGRVLTIVDMPKADGPAIVERLRHDQYDLVILPLPDESPGQSCTAPSTSAAATSFGTPIAASSWRPRRESRRRWSIRRPA